MSLRKVPGETGLGERRIWENVFKNSGASQNSLKAPPTFTKKHAKNVQKGSKMSVRKASGKTGLGGPPGDRTFGTYLGTILILRGPLENPNWRQNAPKTPKEGDLGKHFQNIANHTPKNHKKVSPKRSFGDLFGDRTTMKPPKC